jgi:hypothetical protein
VNGADDFAHYSNGDHTHSITVTLFLKMKVAESERVFVEPKVNESKKSIMTVKVKSIKYGCFLYHSLFLSK